MEEFLDIVELRAGLDEAKKDLREGDGQCWVFGDGAFHIGRLYGPTTLSTNHTTDVIPFKRKKNYIKITHCCFSYVHF